LVSGLLSGLVAFSEAAGKVRGAPRKPAKPINSNPTIAKWKRLCALPTTRSSDLTRNHDPVTPRAMLITPYFKTPCGPF
jgi:BRCT domain type II-containing protein